MSTGSLWIAVAAASALCLALKLAGFVVPASWVGGGRVGRVVDLLPIALLSGLVTVQTFGGDERELVVDARLIAMMVVVPLILRRVNFLAVVATGAAIAAGLRALGMA